MLQSYLGAIHYGPGVDQEIDTAWQPTTGPWDWEMTHADYQAYARHTFNVGNLFQFDFGGEWVQFDPQSLNWIDQDNSRQQIAIKQAVTAQASDDELLFEDAYGAGINFQYETGSSKLIKFITIDGAARLPAPTVGPTVWLELEFSLSASSGVDFYLDGNLWQRQNNVRVRTAERIEVRDAATGTQVLWWIDYPRAYDANDDTVIGEMEVRRQGGPNSLFICVRIPKTWIDAATFPIIIDPTVDTDVAASGDDGAWYEGNSGFVNDTAALIFGDQGSPQYASNSFQRFTVSGPESGDTADVAYVTVKSRSTRSGAMTVFTCCVDADDPAAPTTYAEAEGASRTTTSSWSVGSWSNNTSYNTDSMVDSVQDVLDRAGWNSGQHWIVYFEDNGSGDFRNYDSYDNGMDMPHLHLEYTVGGGATQKSIAGGITPTGAVSTKALWHVSLAGGITPTGALTRFSQFYRSFAGGITPSGALVRKSTRDLGGGITPSGDVATQVRATASLAGSVTPTGALGTFGQFFRSLVGSITPTGAVIKKTTKSVGGGITPAGAITKKSTRDLAGGITPSGGVATQVRATQSVAGSLTPSGVVSMVCQFFRSLAGSITPAGTLTKILNPSGIVRRLRMLLGVGE